MTRLIDERVVETARRWTGTPYLHQASKRGVGCDCLGLVRGVWRDLFGAEPETPPPYTSVWADADRSETLLAAAQRNFVECPQGHVTPGAVLVFRLRPQHPAKHAGIVSAPGHFIHAYEANDVVESELSTFWTSRIAGVFRFPDEPPVAE